MADFKTTKRKFQYIDNRLITNAINIDKQKTTNSFIDKGLLARIPKQRTLKTIREKSTDWELMTPGGTSTLSPYEEQYISWNIVFDKMDERLIPYIKTDIIFREIGETDDGVLLTHMQYNKFFEIEELEPVSSIMKKVTVHLCLYFGDRYEPVKPEVPYEAKVLVDLIDPRMYV